MKTKGIFLPQETMETCGISCILMALTAFNKIRKPKPVRSGEMSLEALFYERYGCKVAKGTLGSAIAYALAMRRLDVSLWHESEALLENKDNYYPDDLHQAILAEHEEYIARGQGAFSVQKGIRIDADALSAELKRDRLLIVQCLIEGNADSMHDHVLHWIIVFDDVDGKFRVYDPLHIRTSQNEPNYIEIEHKAMNMYMKTPVGASVISVGER